MLILSLLGNIPRITFANICSWVDRFVVPRRNVVIIVFLTFFLSALLDFETIRRITPDVLFRAIRAAVAPFFRTWVGKTKKVIGEMDEK